MTAPARIEVSVIVPVRDAGDGLARLLDALGRQTLSPERFEVLVGDDGSTDGAPERLPPGPLSVRVLRCAPRTSYAARNRAAAGARGRVLAFTDADCRPDPEWLERGLAAAASRPLVAGRVRPDTGGAPVGIWGMLDADAYLDQERAVRNRLAATANLFVDRELFERVGGFDPSLPSNGDHDLVRRCLALGTAVTYAPQAAVSHPLRDSRAAFLAKYWRTNRAYGARRARARQPLGTWGLLIPVWRPLRARRSVGRSVGLDRARLRDAGIRPRLHQDAAGLALIYLVLPYLAVAARVAGWRAARHHRPLALTTSASS